MGKLGFRAEDADDEDEEQSAALLDGQSSDGGYSPEAFVSMCERLRDLGAVEVKMGDMRAMFERIEIKMQPTTIQSESTPAPKKKPKPPVAPILSPEARAEAEREQRLRELTGGL